MTGKERLTNICSRLPVDRLAWTTLVDDLSRSCMTAEVREMPVADFYRFVGCDHLQFGNYGLPEDQQVAWCQLVPPELSEEVETRPDGLVIRKTRSVWGTLTATFKNGHPVKYPVESLEELHTLKMIWLNSHYEETEGTEERWSRMTDAIGESGIYCYTFGPSPMQHLLEFEMGMNNFYCLLQDHPEEMKEVLDIIHACRCQEYEITARKMPALVGIPVENTSSSMISPTLYEKYSLPQIRDYVDILHRHDKKAILHMCGLLKNLLPVLKDTGLDGINGLTPAPVGDTPYETALDCLGEDLIILGGVLNPTVVHNPSATARAIEEELDRIYNERIRSSHFLLWFAVDGLPTPLERFQIISDWFGRKG